jgi:hypothetical protein
MIKFEDVKVGMAGLTYNDEAVIILAKGKVKDFATESDLEGLGLDLEENAVKIRYNDGEITWFVYGYDGVICK